MKERNVFEILSVLERSNRPMTSAEIKAELDDLGIRLTDRMIRNYLQDFDKKGFTAQIGREGRKITESGRDELKMSFLYGRADLILDKITRMITDMRFDLDRKRGEVIVNLSLIEDDKEEEIKRVLKDLCRSSLFPQPIKIMHSGGRLCNRIVPDGMFGLATMSSVSIDQILLNYGVYLTVSAGLTLNVKDCRPVRCTNLIQPSGCSIDAIELFMMAKLQSINDAVIKGDGDVLAEFEEIPYTARTRVIALLRKAAEVFGGTIIVGKPEGITMGIPTRQGYIGLIVVCGESLPAALEELGIKTNTEMVAGAINFKELEPIAPVKGEVILL